MCANFQLKWTALNFWSKFEEIAQLRAYFGSNIVEGVVESWVEAEMSWVEEVGA